MLQLLTNFFRSKSPDDSFPKRRKRRSTPFGKCFDPFPARTRLKVPTVIVVIDNAFVRLASYPNFALIWIVLSERSIFWFSSHKSTDSFSEALVTAVYASLRVLSTE